MLVDTASRSPCSAVIAASEGAEPSAGTLSRKRWTAGQTSQSTNGRAISPVMNESMIRATARAPHEASGNGATPAGAPYPGAIGPGGRGAGGGGGIGTGAPGTLGAGAVVSTDVEAPQRWPSHHRT